MKKYNTISEAWFNICKDILDHGIEYKIERGSFEGQKRKQLYQLSFMITNPETRPLGIQYKGKQISNDNEIETYFLKYLLSDTVEKNEEYSYGQRLSRFLPNIVDILYRTPNTNQAVVEIARPEDILLNDPPCIRLLSWKIVNNTLQLSCFFRSWDCFSGLPTNLGGLQLLNEMIAEMIGIKAGNLVGYSDGAHIYDYCWELFN